VACASLGLYSEGIVLYGFTIFFKPIVTEFGWSYLQVSLAFSICCLATGFLTPIVGFVVDRWGPRKLVLLGTFVGGLGFALLSRISSLGMLYGGFILVAIGWSSCSSTVLVTTAAKWYESRKGFGIVAGVILSGYTCGGLLVPAIACLIDTYGWRTSLIILGAGMWLIGIPLSRVFSPPAKRGSSNISSSSPPDEDRPGSFLWGDSLRMEIGLKEALTHRAFWHLTLAAALQIIAGIAVITHVVPYLDSIGIARSNAIFVATLIPLLTIPGTIGFGWISDVLPGKWAFSGALCLISLALLVFSYAMTPPFLWCFLILFGLGHGGVITLRRSVQRQYFGTLAFGRIHGVTMSIVMTAAAAGPAIAGWAFDFMKSYHMIWIVFAGLLLVACVLIMTMPKIPQLDTESDNKKRRQK